MMIDDDNSYYDRDDDNDVDDTRIYHEQVITKFDKIENDSNYDREEDKENN